MRKRFWYWAYRKAEEFRQFAYGKVVADELRDFTGALDRNPTVINKEYYARLYHLKAELSDPTPMKSRSNSDTKYKPLVQI